MKTVFNRIMIPLFILIPLLVDHPAFAFDFTELENRASREEVEAMFELGEMHEKGIGTVQNYVEAHKWYNIAASLGYAKAIDARDAVAEKMTIQQLADAQKLALQWKVKKSKVHENNDYQKVKDQIIRDILQAAQEGDIETLKELLAMESDRNMTDDKGWFSLIYAAFGGHEEIVKTIINAGADINRKTADSTTALIAASMQGNYSIVKLLLEGGADKTVRNNYGLNALNMAMQSGYDEIVELLVINLRSSYMDLGYDQVKTIVKKYNFPDHLSNETGEFLNEYEQKEIKGTEVVQDNNTKLMWHRSGSEKDMKWEDAKKWIEGLNAREYAGYNDWRLPTVEEALSLLESDENDDYLYIDPVFDITQRLIWTGDSYGTRGAWSVNFATGGVIWRFTNLTLYVRPVRSDK